MFWFSRIVQQVIYPDNIGGILLIIAFILWRKGRNRIALQLTISAIVLVTIPSIPIVSWGLLRIVEQAYPSRPIDNYPSADAIVVLGGTVGRISPPRYEPEEMGGSRMLPAARLFHRSKAGWVIVCGGDPYHSPSGEVRTQADDMRDVLKDMGVPQERILLESQSRNTEENLLFAEKILLQRNLKTALLVTNAFHMQRAMVLSRKTSIQWYPVPTGFEAADVPFSLASFVPGLGNLRDTNRTLKEIVGLQWARLRSPASSKQR